MLPPVDDAVPTGLHAPADRAVVVSAGLPYADRDAAAFRAFLVATAGVPEEAVALLTDPDPAALLAAVDTASATRGRVWVYFAGAGERTPTGGDRLRLTGGDVALAEVRERAGRGGGQVLLVVDASFPGSLPSTRPPIGLTEWTAGERVPLDAAGHGAFTYALLGALRGWADGVRTGVRDGRVTLDEADRYVRDALQTLHVAALPSLVGDRTRTLPAGAEEAPVLDPVRLDGALPTVTVLSVPYERDLHGPPGSVRIVSRVPLVVRVDGAPAILRDGDLVVDGVRAGRRTVVVETLDGKPVTSLDVEVAPGEELRLLYQNAALLAVP